MGNNCTVPSPTIFWFRRDLRLNDNPALATASARGPVLGVFINDPALRRPSGANRLGFLAQTLQGLDAELNGNLVVRTGHPLDVVSELCQLTGADAVYATDDHGPYGRRRDTGVGQGLATKGVETHFLDSNYAVAPNSIFSGAGTPYKVFTPFFKVWKQHGWDDPIEAPKVDWVAGVDTEGPPPVPEEIATLPAVGEQAAFDRAEEFLDSRVMDYPEARNKPGVPGTSFLSPYLKWGNIHPRQILAMLGADPAEDVFRSEIAWREFYADVLFQRPETARESLIANMARIEADTGPAAREQFDRWCSGTTGFPIVDAGMRQLVATGWMHNRVRMIVASFLVKDLHLPWQWGARFFMQHLIDGDLASNSHGWQWVAGSGTDASPFYRVFNPTGQSRKFDPDGAYIRQWIPEIAHMSDADIHEPGIGKAGPPSGYPAPMVDHAAERLEALARLEKIKKR